MELTENDKKAIEEYGGYFRTVMGRKVFIKEGQSLKDAMKASGKFKKEIMGKKLANTIKKVAESKAKKQAEAKAKIQEKLEKKKVEIRFRKQLSLLNKENHKTNDKSYLSLGKTPQVLIDKAGLPNLPLMMSYKKAYLAVNHNDGVYSGENYHGLGVGVLSSLPTALHKPKGIYRHKTNPKRIVVIVELKDGKGRNVLTSIEFDTVSEIRGKQAKSNNLITAFGANEKYLKKIQLEWERIE